MRIIVAIDDTDTPATRGTGHLAEEIAQGVVEAGWGTRTFVSRHQLFVHPDVPYTSHNSAMCFTAEVPAAALPQVVAGAVALLEERSAPGSDPGLCVAVPERLGAGAELVAWGRRAKREVLTQAEARALAARLGVHLSAHGGTGQGIVGALAGVGLRLEGNDGRVRGHLDGVADGTVATADELRRLLGVEALATADGRPIPGAGRVRVLGERQKAVVRGGRATLLVEPDGEAGPAAWRTSPRDVVRTY